VSNLGGSQPGVNSGYKSCLARSHPGFNSRSRSTSLTKSCCARPTWPPSRTQVWPLPSSKCQCKCSEACSSKNQSSLSRPNWPRPRRRTRWRIWRGAREWRWRCSGGSRSKSSGRSPRSRRNFRPLVGCWCLGNPEWKQFNFNLILQWALFYGIKDSGINWLMWSDLSRMTIAKLLFRTQCRYIETHLLIIISQSWESACLCPKVIPLRVCHCMLNVLVSIIIQYNTKWLCVFSIETFPTTTVF